MAKYTNTRPAPIRLPDGSWAMPGSNFDTMSQRKGPSGAMEPYDRDSDFLKNRGFALFLQAKVLVPAVDDAPPIAVPARMEKGAPVPTRKVPGASKAKAAPPPPPAPEPTPEPAAPEPPPVDIASMDEDTLLAFAAKNSDNPEVMKAVHARAVELSKPRG